MTPDLTYDALVEWLRAKQPEDEIGIRGDAFACPVQRYMQEQYPAHSWYVTSRYCFYTEGTDTAISVKLAPWARAFITMLDAGVYWQQHVGPREISAQEAQALLISAGKMRC